MTNDPSRTQRLALLRWALLAVAMLASAAVAAVAWFAAYLFSQGYSGGDPQSVAPLAFPLSFLVLVVAGLPASFACAAGWIGYVAVARKSRKPSDSPATIQPMGNNQ